MRLSAATYTLHVDHLEKLIEVWRFGIKVHEGPLRCAADLAILGAVLLSASGDVPLPKCDTPDDTPPNVALLRYMSEDMTVELEPQLVDLGKSHELVVAGSPILGTTSQDDKDEGESPQDAIEPPVSFEALARLSTANAARRAIIDAIARNTVGLGYSIALAESHESEVSDRTKEIGDVRATLEACAARDKRLDSPSFTELLMAVKTDEEEVGNGYIEVSRNKLNGKIDGLFHVPGKRVRRRRDREGFMLLGPNSATFSIADRVDFYNFGEKVKYTEEGLPTNALKGGKNWGRNELLPFRIYSSETRDYGLPRDTALALEYLGDKKAAESNISFFDSSGTPPTVIFVQGEEARDGSRVTFKVPQTTVDRIASTLKSDSGHRHRVGIIPLPPGSNVNAVQLGKISDRDMGFVDYRADNKRRALSAFRLSPVFISDTEDGGRYTAEVQRSISLEQVFDPEQSRYETRLHNTLMKDLGFPQYRVVFKRLAVENDAARRDSVDKMAETGTVTRREHRKAHGYAALPEAAKSATEIEFNGRQYKSAEPGPGEVPFGWNDEIISKDPPPGAENRVVEGTGQKGLKPEIGGRQRRQAVRHGDD